MNDYLEKIKQEAYIDELKKMASTGVATQIATALTAGLSSGGCSSPC
jgi:hypothetical protein